MDGVVLLAFRSVFPLLALMAAGMILGGRGMLSQQTIRQLNVASAKFFIPCLLFTNVYSADLESAFDLSLFVLEGLCVLAVFAVLYLLVPLIVKEKKQQLSVSCCLYWPNCTMFGLPILTSLCGSQGRLIGTIMIATVAPMFSAGSVVFLEKYRSRGRLRPGTLIWRVLGNPMLWGSALGIGCNLLKISIPPALLSPITSVAGLATPLALICLGAFCKWGAAVRLLKQTAVVCGIKLFLIPLCTLLVGYFFGYRDIQLLGLLIVFASPSAVSTFSIAQPEFADCELSALLVSAASLLSVGSYFLWIIALHAFGLF